MKKVARMEFIPSTLVMYRCTHGVESCLATLRSPFATSLLEQQLGAVSAGRYQRATGADGTKWVFAKISESWSKEVDPESYDKEAPAFNNDD
jgi:hypothetical protein